MNQEIEQPEQIHEDLPLDHEMIAQDQGEHWKQK